ncbi:MAG: Hydantoinase/oxoprolinase [Methanosaeta sp. PtaB.Bin018]|nr:hydantoinase/oxoprolinase family protein [Methanothrix sp.]OPX76066.1 MAG: Hydantoinase/oxoprolinase [Methanosaeta sp. PtaB.Bin018]OPY45850.1 MAG: Hydantoinase/oxoprolinase [Methanosaeta sp. PtaU1.Bin016]
MLVGIDVGGTTTDAVLVEGNSVVKAAYVPTDHDDLLKCLLGALDELVKDVDTRKIERVVLSTTLITNMIAEGKTDPVALVLIPGPGTNPKDYNLGEACILDGAIDYRGREIDRLKESQIKEAASKISAQGLARIAVVGKFCQRNHAHEQKVGEIMRAALPGAKIELGHRVSGHLNFPRRAATTLLTVATKDKYREFAQAMADALRQRKISAPVYILKADGGTLPLDSSVQMPVETIFSGPAASIMGVLALTPAGQTSVIVDIGGTTTDLALILSGKPLLSSKGAKVESLLTHVRAFAVKSVAIGGDSAVDVSDERMTVGPQRKGPAFCMGGPCATPTDAMRVLGLTSVGDAARAEKAMQEVANKLNCSPKEAAQKIVDAVVDKIVAEVGEMFRAWEQEPAYRIWEIMKKERLEAQNVVGVGGGAPPLVPLVASRLGASAIVPDFARVANAIGAAVARPTITLNLHIDTERGEYIVAEDGLTGKVGDRKMTPEQAEKLARKLLDERAERLGIGEYSGEAEVTYSEVFNMIRGWSTVGRLLDIRMEIPAGLLASWRGC